MKDLPFSEHPDISDTVQTSFDFSADDSHRLLVNFDEEPVSRSEGRDYTFDVYQGGVYDGK